MTGSTSKSTPIAQLPIDLQNQIRNGTGLTPVEHALGTHTPGSIALAVLIVVATAGVVSGLVAVLRYPAAAFSEPVRWIPMILGAVTLGSVFGHLSRRDFRPKGTNALLVGPTSLVVVQRDTVRVLPAEHVTRAPNRIVFDGKPVVTGFQTTEWIAELDAARKAAGDADARAADRWRAATSGKAPPINSWTPVVHGAVFALALAVTLEAGLGSAQKRTAGEWGELAARSEAMSTKVAGLRAQRVDTAIAGGPDAILERLYSHDGEDPASGQRLARAFVEQLGARIAKAKTVGDVAPLVELAAGAHNQHLVEAKLGEVVATGRARFAAVAIATLSDDQHDIARVLQTARALGIQNGLDPVYAKYDELTAKLVTKQTVATLRHAVEAVLPNPETPRLVPKTYAALRAAAEQLVETGAPADYEDLLADAKLPILTDRALRTAAGRARTIDELDAIGDCARRNGSDLDLGTFVRGPLERELRAAKESDDFVRLWDQVSDYKGGGAIVERAARARVAGLGTVTELARWANTDLFEDDLVGIRADALATTGTTADAHAYLENYAFSRRPKAATVEAALPRRCDARFPNTRDVRHLAGRELCKSAYRTLSYTSNSYLAVDVAGAIAKEITQLAGPDRMAIEIEGNSYDGTIRIEVDDSVETAADRAQEAAADSGKPKAFPCKATVTWVENDEIKLTKTFTCTAEP